jgi:hypothetical protein
LDFSIAFVLSVQQKAELRDMMGRGEAACLALVATGGFHIVSDEKKRFKRKAIELIGEARILRTACASSKIAFGDFVEPSMSF